MKVVFWVSIIFPFLENLMPKKHFMLHLWNEPRSSTSCSDFPLGAAFHVTSSSPSPMSSPTTDESPLGSPASFRYKNQDVIQMEKSSDRLSTYVES